MLKNNIKEILADELNDKNLTCLELKNCQSTNYLIKSIKGNFILNKYAYTSYQNDLIDSVNTILLKLKDTSDGRFPYPINFKDQSLIKKVTDKGQDQLMRILSYIEGSYLTETKQKIETYDAIGTFLAEMNIKLQNINSYVIESKQSSLDLQYLDLNKVYIDDIDDVTIRNIVYYFFEQFQQQIRPIFSRFRKQIIHNNASQRNILIQNDIVAGLINFDHIAHSFLINELATAITYCCYDKENPLNYAERILKSYHKVLALQEIEVDSLYYLIAARLCVIICHSTQIQNSNLKNTDTLTDKEYAVQMLHKWIAINPIYAKNKFRKATGFESIKAPSIKSVIAQRNKYISKSLSLSYKEPINMIGSAFQYMYDANGTTYLDAYNNIPHVGHCHPKVIRAGQNQMSLLNTNTRYLHHGLVDYAEKLLSKFPSSLNKVFFVNSGSAASDLAIRLAKMHTGHNQIMVMELGYHGNTQSSIDISDYKFSNPKGEGKKQHIIKTAIPNTYNGKYTNDIKNPGLMYAKDAKKQIEQSKEPIAAFIAEPIVGCAGQVPLAPHYLKEVYPAIRAQGGVCISDEVQTGFGRLGEYFWGYESQEVIPDIVILGKPIANGHPMGAVVTTDEIAKSFETGVEFFSSFGGNPVSCSIGLAVLEVIGEENLQDNAKLVGQYYKKLLKSLMMKYSYIGDVRGMGLFLGVEIVMPDSNKPNTALAQFIKNQFRKNNILISTDGPFDNIIKSKPPLCFTKKNALDVVNLLESILEKYSDNSV